MTEPAAIDGAATGVLTHWVQILGASVVGVLKSRPAVTGVPAGNVRPQVATEVAEIGELRVAQSQALCCIQKVPLLYAESAEQPPCIVHHASREEVLCVHGAADRVVLAGWQQ